MNAGDRIAERYRLLRPIGSGGMATVWAARHEMLERDFALKLATVSSLASPAARARFLREARIIGGLRHPNVVNVVDVGDAAPFDALYIAMELLEGQSLAERLAAEGPLELVEALAIAGGIARGLAATHATGVVHRDVKPENIFLARDPRLGVVPKLLDFGISKGATEGLGGETMHGQILGTPAYMCPEQALGEEEVDHRADIWALGVVLYEMLTGRRPFTADDHASLIILIAAEEFDPLPASIPASVQAIVARCLAKASANRFPSAEALNAALSAVLRTTAAVTASSKSSPPARVPSLSGRFWGRDAGRLLRATIGSVGLAVIAGAGLWGASRVAAPMAVPLAHSGLAAHLVDARPRPTEPTRSSAPRPADQAPEDLPAASLASNLPASTASTSDVPRTKPLLRRPPATGARATPKVMKAATRINDAGF